MNSEALKRFAPALFVLLWSTGFIVARYSTRDAGPLTFLTVRTCIAATLLFLVARLVHELPVNRSQIRLQAVVGIGMHAMYLGGVFVAVDHGLPSGISALIAALHPVVTTVLSRFVLGEQITPRRGIGVALGLAGVIAVVVERGGAGDGVSAFALCSMCVAVVGMSAGTLVQRRYGQHTPLLQGTAWQYTATALALGIIAVFGEGWDIHFTRQTVLSLAWAVGVLSISAVLIMLWLLHRQAASAVSSLFFLTPALSTVEGAILFQEHLGVLSLFGLLVAVVGVWLATSSSGVTSLQK